MLMSRSEFGQYKAFEQLTDAILKRDQARTAELFYAMVTEEDCTVGEALSVVTAAEAPFVQVPNHIMVRDGQIVLVNNDHTILGLRTSTQLMSYLPEQYRLLPLLQSVWYIPAGLDIWNQLLGKYPGRYAAMKGMNVPPPDYGPVVWQQDQQPIREGGTLEERLGAHMLATVSGDVKRSYGMFLDLAEDEQARPKLREQILFLGLIDIQDTIMGRKARNTGHKALRARAIADLAEFVGWQRAHGVFYTGVPDMAVGPLYYSAYDAACVMLANAFPDGGKRLREVNQIPLTEDEVEGFVETLMIAEPAAVWDQVTTHLKNGRSVRSLGDAIQIGAAELILRNTVPRSFTDGQHPFDYCNTANYWIRTTESPYQPRVLYLMANFVNDAARANKWFKPVLASECAMFDASARSSDALLRELDGAITALDIPRSTAIANAYLRSGADRGAFQATVGMTASKFQDDPHNQKIAHSAFQEYEHNTTHLRDRLLLAAVRQLAGWPKMPGELECYGRFMRDWIRH